MKILIILISLILSPAISHAFGSDLKIPGDNFTKLFEEFKADFNSKNITALNKYVDPEHGFFVLDNPGATVNGYYFNSFDSIFNSSKESDLYRMKKIELNCKPVEGDLPHYRCDSKEGWDKEGCYYDDTPERNSTFGVYGFVDEFGNSGFDENGNFNETHNSLQARFNRNIEQFDNAFYATDSFIGLYFGERDGKIYLLMMDLVTPCEA